MNDKAPRLRIIDGGLARNASSRMRKDDWCPRSDTGTGLGELPAANVSHDPRRKWWLAAAIGSVMMSSLAISALAAAWLLHGAGPLLAWHPTNVYYAPASREMRPPQRLAALPPQASHASSAPSVHSASHRTHPLRQANSGPLLVFVPMPGPVSSPTANAATYPDATDAHASAKPPAKDTIVRVVSRSETNPPDAPDGTPSQFAVFRNGEPIVVAIDRDKAVSSDPGKLDVVVKFSAISALFRALPEAEQREILDELSKKVLEMSAGNKAPAPDSAVAPPVAPKAQSAAVPDQKAGTATASASGGAGDASPAKPQNGKPEHMVTYIDQDWETPDSL